MKVRNHSLVFCFLASVLCSPAGGAAPAGVETSSDPSFDPRLFPKIAVIVVEEGAERTSVTVKRNGTERSTSILFSDQTRLERAIEDEFMSALMNKRYTLSTRSDLLSILKEQAVQDLALTEDNSAGIGKVLKVQAVMLVRLTTASKTSVSMGARLLSVDGAKILWTGRRSQQVPVTDTSRRVQAIVMAAKYIASAFPKREGDALPPDKPESAKPAWLPGKIPLAPTVSAATRPESSAALTNSIGMKLILIPAGEFLMGSSDSDSEKPEEKPRHRVKITKAFHFGMYEVTQAEFQQVMGTNPSRFKESGGTAPVERVSWEDAQEFLRTLSALPEEQAAGRRYRLPTEAEWEYCCRAGSETRYSFGDSEAELPKHAWYEKNSGNETHPVGQKTPNAWGLYDMHGNVWEWCADEYGPYQAGTVSDPGGAGTVAYRVVRGGSWYDDGGGCRSANRFRDFPGNQYLNNGLRVVLVRPDAR